MDVPLIILDREVARAAERAMQGRARLHRGDDLDAPSPLASQRRVSSRATWVELAESKDPLAAPLRTWVGALTLERVLWPDQARLAAAWRAASIPIEMSGIVPFVASPRDLLRCVLGEPEPGRRRVFADALVRGAGPVTDAARILAERRAEATRLLGEGGDAAEVPIDPRGAITTIAERVITETAPFVMEAGGSWADAIAAGVGRSAGEGWPARLNARWLFELFNRGPLVEGLRLDLAPLPEALGASSFARALAAFGAALADVDGPRSSPFVVARAPFDLRRARRAALFGSLAADAVFGVRALGLGRGRARDQAREIARALVVSLRLDAARVLLRDVLLLPARQRDSRFEERTFAALGAPIPPALAGVVPRLGQEDPVRLAGTLIAIADRRALIERFDEDWFLSPHAARAIREEDAVPAEPIAKAAAIEAGLAELTRALHELG
ncbi:MAG: hypothetical protein QM820_13725 [Minicystis sp.]